MRLGNGSSIVTTNTTAEGPRGNSLSCLILDEFAFVAPEIAQQFWTSVTPTLTNNPNARMFVSSTPNGIGNMFHTLYERAESGKNNFVIQKVIWSDVPGRDEEWKKRTIVDDCLGDEEMFAQEYECKFLGASNSPFPQQTFDKISKDISDPILRDMDGYLQIWKLPENDRVYTMGVDVSEGVGLDASVVQVMDITDLNQIE
jgi:phage FluMu gp28-like protein